MPIKLAYQDEEHAQTGQFFGVNKAKKCVRISGLIPKWPGNKANWTRFRLAFGGLAPKQTQSARRSSRRQHDPTRSQTYRTS